MERKITAMELMVFLIFFNIALFTISALGIYNFDVVTNEALSNPETYKSGTPESLLLAILGDVFLGLIAGFALGTAVAYFSRVPSDKGAAYTLLSGMFWGSLGWSAGVINAIVGIGGIPESITFGLNVIVSVFFFSCGIIFTWTMWKLATGQE